MMCVCLVVTGVKGELFRFEGVCFVIGDRENVLEVVERLESVSRDVR